MVLFQGATNGLRVDDQGERGIRCDIERGVRCEIEHGGHGAATGTVVNVYRLG